MSFVRVQHKFQEDHNAVNLIAVSHKICVVMIGTTGVGKSSLVNIFASKHAEVSSSTTSTTKGCTLFHGNLFDYLDAQGAGDSDMKDDDEKVLKQILKKLYKENISKVKLIWIVAGDMVRSKAEYKNQARFIKSFQDCNTNANDSNSGSVWSSCLIIKKNGSFLPKLAGVIEAANYAGSNIDYGHDGSSFLFGYTCLDWLSQTSFEEIPALRLLHKLVKDEEERNAELLKEGFLTTNQIKSEVLERLKNMSILNIAFKHQKCEKCGTVGDERFIYEKCHLQIEKYHSKDFEFFHLQKTEFYHSAALVKFHPENYEKYHFGQLINYHPKDIELIHKTQQTEYYHSLGKERYHDGSLQKIDGGKYHPNKTKTPYCKTCKKDVLESHFFVPYNFNVVNFFVHMLPPVIAHDAIVVATRCFISDRKYYYKCRNCQSDTNTEGCTPTNRSSTREWTCCDGFSGSKGCEKRYRCCEEDIDSSQGCKQRYECCKRPIGFVGCYEQYKCCQQARNSNGCKQKYECCNGITNSSGCRMRYKCCRDDIGFVGCKDKYSCCDGEPNSIGCKERYMCCMGAKKTVGCSTRYECCHVLYPAKNDINNVVIVYGADIYGCKNRCSRCKLEWGVPPGCTYPEKNQHS